MSTSCSPARRGCGARARHRCRGRAALGRVQSSRAPARRHRRHLRRQRPPRAPVPRRRRRSSHRFSARPDPTPRRSGLSSIVFTNDRFAYNESSASDRRRRASASDEIRLVSDSIAGGCKNGDEGRYSWAPTPGGTKFTFTLVSDDCDARGLGPARRVAARGVRKPRQRLPRPARGRHYSSHFVDPFVSRSGAAGRPASAPSSTRCRTAGRTPATGPSSTTCKRTDDPTPPGSSWSPT